MHQLDFATSGVLCIALNKRAAGAAGKLFQARAVDKCYLALVDGHTSFDHTRVEAGIAPPGSNRRNHRQDQAALTVLAHQAGVACRRMHLSVHYHPADPSDALPAALCDNLRSRLAQFDTYAQELQTSRAKSASTTTTPLRTVK